jgi:hypothetical protein
MKKLVTLITLAVFALSVPIAMAAGEPQAGGSQGSPSVTADKAAKTINCCVKGKCEQSKSEADCVKSGGKVVKDCTECK